jgi:hypothetical protein
MKSTLLWSLAGLNLLLAAILVAKVVPDNHAMAQVRRGGADYLLIPGAATGLNYSIVYVLDQTNSQLTAMAWNDNAKRMETLPGVIDLNRMMGDGGGNEVPAKGGRK